jgi:hypothetical protein
VRKGAAPVRATRNGASEGARSASRPGDAAVKKATGKDWSQWFALLDKSGAKKMDHKAMAAHLYDVLGCPGWWSQMIAVGYEQQHGLRQKYEKPDGFEISRGKTIDIALSDLFAAWSDEKKRGRWLEVRPTVRKATLEKSMRITWPDGTSVSVNFYSKGPAKSMLSLQHGKLATAQHAEKMKAWWEAALERLKTALEG